MRFPHVCITGQSSIYDNKYLYMYVHAYNIVSWTHTTFQGVSVAASILTHAIISQVSTHAGQNRELHVCLSAHGC